MAEFVVGGKVTIDASSAEKSVGNIKQQLREAQKELLSVSEKFGATSKEAVAAAKKVANFKDAIGDAKLLSDAFNPDAKFKAFSNALQGVTGGFAAVQGAQALFGSESENLTKTLAKVQGAMALSQGLNSVMEAKDSFKALGTLIKTNVSSAFGTLRGAIISTGIGALVVGLGLLIANFDKVKKVVMNLIPGLAGIADFITGIVNKITDFVGVTSEAQRETEKFIAKTEAQIKKTEDFLDANGDKYDQYTQRKIKANLDYNKKAVELAKDETRTDEEKQALLKDYRDKANREINKATDDRQKALDDAHQKEVEKENGKKDKLKAIADQHAKEILQANEQLIKETKSLQDENYLNTIKDDDFRAKEKIRLDYENKKKEIEQSIAGEQEKQDLIKQLQIKANNDVIALNDAKNKKLAEDNKNALDQAQALADENYLHTITNENDRAKAKADLDYQKKIEETNALTISEFEKNSLLQQLSIQHQNTITDIEKKAHDDRQKQDEAAFQAKQNNLAAIGGLVGQLAGLVGESTSVGKALTLAQIGIDTAAAISALTRNSEANPANAFTGGIAGTIQFAAGIVKILANIAKAKQILSQSNAPGMKGGGGGGGSVSAPSAPIPPQLQTTTLNQGQIQQMGNAAVRSFVLESDVSGNQERIRRLNRAARIS